MKLTITEKVGVSQVLTRLVETAERLLTFSQVLNICYNTVFIKTFLQLTQYASFNNKITNR